MFTENHNLAIPSNSFNLDHDSKHTINMGDLVPVLCTEMVPGDKFTYRNNILTRLMPMVSPAMSKIDLTTFVAFVPDRLIWDNAPKFFTNPVPDATTPVRPFFQNIQVNIGDLLDHLGVPTITYMKSDGTIGQQYEQLPYVSAMQAAAYQKFYNDWVRDENLVNNGQETFTILADGVQDHSAGNELTKMRKRAWRHDYFTSCLPFAQKGEAVEIPIGSFADVPVENGNSGFLVNRINGTASTGSNIRLGELGAPNQYNVVASSAMPEGSALSVDTSNWVAKTSELGTASAVTINTLRWAEALQKFLEANARGGTRYIEMIRQHFGVRSSDARLQRAEFLGFSVNPITISEVLQTSPSSEDTTPLGEMAGHGVAFSNTKSVHYTAEEHGYFLVMVSMRPKTSYMQGLHRQFTRKSPLDFLWPLFARLGEQEVKNQEIFATGDGIQDELTFGYMMRYGEYRYLGDRSAGQMRTSYVHWHMDRIFESLPVLNQEFIEANPTKRIFAVNIPGEDTVLINVSHKLNARRPLPKFVIPSLT